MIRSVLVDGKHPARCIESYPQGSTSYLFPHYVVIFTGSRERTVISAKRVVFP